METQARFVLSAWLGMTLVQKAPPSSSGQGCSLCLTPEALDSIPSVAGVRGGEKEKGKKESVSLQVTVQEKKQAACTYK